MFESLDIVEGSEEIRLRIWAKPRASRSRVIGVREGALEVALAAPPVDGAANQELLKTLAKALGLAKSQISLVAGESAKQKRVSIRGLGVGELRARLDAEVSS